MELYRNEWGNGIAYNHLSTDRFKTGYFCVNFLLPLQAESAAYYALIPKLLLRGSRDYPNQQVISRRLEELYGADVLSRNFKRGEIHLVSMGIDILDNDYLPRDEKMDLLAESIALLKSLLTDPCMENGCFLQDYTDGEIRNRILAIRAMINNKQRMALELCYRHMFADEAAGVSVEGRIEDYEALDREKLVAYYQHMLQGARIEIFYVGGAPVERVEGLAKTIFREIPRSKNEAEIPSIEIRRSAESVRSFEECVPTEQGILVMGFRTGVVLRDEDHLALSLFNEIFGGSPASKLFMNVREERSLCYYCSSFADLLKGTLTVIAGIDPKNKDITVDEIKNQLEEMKNGNMNGEELLCAKQSLSNAYRSILDTPDGMESWYLRRFIGGMSDSPLENAKNIEKITADDISAVAKKISLDTVFFLRGEGVSADSTMQEAL